MSSNGNQTKGHSSNNHSHSFLWFFVIMCMLSPFGPCSISVPSGYIIDVKRAVNKVEELEQRISVLEGDNENNQENSEENND